MADPKAFEREVEEFRALQRGTRKTSLAFRGVAPPLAGADADDSRTPPPSHIPPHTLEPINQQHHQTCKSCRTSGGSSSRSRARTRWCST